ncbi:hypothetical protein GOV04_01835 [Candidatus Woesearchaeota archaeon]|nr:hypothetical protein [Candidatus Woesearchaeota archaeon]
MFSARKAQKSPTGGGASTLLIIIGLMIVLYIIFLPPSVREEVLSDAPIDGSGGSSGTGSGSGSSSGSGTTNTVSEEVVLREGPVVLQYLPDDSIEHELQSVRVVKTPQAEIIAQKTSLISTKSWFADNSQNLNFKIGDLSNTDSVQLSFLTTTSKGPLVIVLNGQEIYNGIVSGPSLTLDLSKEYLTDDNNLIFIAASTGYKFWGVNKQALNNLRITASVADASTSIAVQYFDFDSEEHANLESAKLSFFVDCVSTERGVYTVWLNNIELVSAVPDCGSFQRPIDVTNLILKGQNKLVFEIEQGDYLIDNLRVNSKVTQSHSPVYFFELDQDLFTELDADDKECGEIDGFCPQGCDADEDKDCCFDEEPGAFWCDVETDELDDRCVSSVSSSTCDRCPAGYEDDDGDPPEDCEGLCGDDDDNSCPTGCSIFYDEDCCFDADRFWCNDVPITGLESVCEVSVSTAECDDCISGYKGDGEKPNCDASTTSSDDTEEELLDDYNVVLKIFFADDFEFKEAEININGDALRIDTRSAEFERNIDRFVRPDYNSIKIIPESTLEITSLEISLENS